MHVHGTWQRTLRSIRIATTFLFVCAVPAAARAQTCVGSGSFAGSPVHLGFDLALADHSSGVHASLGFGGKVPFGGVAIAATRIEGLDEAATGLVFFGGAQLGGGRVSVCPMADLEFMKGPNVGTAEVKGVGFAVGARLGIVAYDGPVRVIPSFGYFRSREEHTTTLGLTETTATQDFGLLQVGVGFVGRKASFGPVLIFPVGLDTFSTQLRLGVSIMF